MRSYNDKRTSDIEWLPLDEDKALSLGDLIRAVSNREVVDAAVAIGAVKKSGKYTNRKRIRLLKTYLTKIRNITPADPSELEYHETYVWVSLVVYRDKHEYFYFDETFTPWAIDRALAQRLLPDGVCCCGKAELIAAIMVSFLFGDSFPPYRCRYSIKHAEHRIISTSGNSS